MTDHVDLSAQLPELTSELFTQATAVIGIRGSGKTNDGVVIVEQAIRHVVPVVVIDPTGVWWGLKSSVDGKAAGLPVYVFGGQHADVPLERDAGATIARFVVERRVPIVLDLSDLSKSAQRRFVADFAETLYDLKARNREPLLLVLDEAARFVPQQLGKDAFLLRCVGAVEDIVALGRSRGLGCVLIGQRPATINKNVLTQADTLIAMRTVGTQDRKAIDEWVTEAQGDQEQRNELVQNIASLKTGEGYFWSPAIFGVFRRVRFGARTTFDSSRTPKIGEKVAAPTAFASVDLEALTAEIAASVEQAKADDPKALRARIADLERDASVVKNVTKIVEKPVIDPELARTILVDWKRDIDRLNQLIVAAGEQMRTTLDAFISSPEFEELCEKIRAITLPSWSQEKAESEPAAVLQRRSLAMGPSPVPTTRASRPAEASSEAGALGGGPMRMLGALAGYPDGRATRVQLGMLSGFTPSGGTFAKYLSQLRSADLVRGDGSMIQITAAGQRAVLDANGFKPIAISSQEIISLWRGKLTGGPRKMLDALIEVYPKGLSRADLGARTAFEPSGGTFAKYLSTLRSGDLIEVRGAIVVANAALFPSGPAR